MNLVDNEKLTHLIYFFADSKAEGETIANEICEGFEASLYAVKQTNRKNFKFKILAPKEEVCDLACELSKRKKTIFVYDKEYLRELSETSMNCRNRYYRDLNYYISRLAEDENKNEEEITELINSEVIFENEIVKDAYNALKEIIPMKDLKIIALNILKKKFKKAPSENDDNIQKGETNE